MSNIKKNDPRRLFYRGFTAHDHIDVDVGDDPIGLIIAESFETRRCPNCSFAFTSYSNAPSTIHPELQNSSELIFVPARILFLCQHCGWWQLRSEGSIIKDGNVEFDLVRDAYQYHSLLEEIDISSNDILLADLKSHLMRRWEDRRLISASKAEQLVADILKEHLACDVYHTTANANTRDGGIDLFVCASDGRVKAAVQVKRRVTRAVELVHEVRNFVGALIVEGYDKGIFVTTASRFSSGAKEVAINPHLKRYRLELELIDGERLLELLKVTSPNPEVALPAGINEHSVWQDVNGSITTTEELLFAREPSSL
jgi:restriction system protein